MPRLPKLPFDRLFESLDREEPRLVLTEPVQGNSTELTKQGKITYKNHDTAQNYFGRYGVNQHCQMCGRIFYDCPMLGLVVATEQVGDTTVLHCDGVFHSPMCAYLALRPLRQNPVYHQSLSWLRQLYPDFEPDDSKPVGQYAIFRPASNLNVVMIPCRLATLEGMSLANV